MRHQPSPGPFGRWFIRRFGQSLTLDVSPTELRLASPARELRIPAAGGPFGDLFAGRAADDPPPYARLVAALRVAFRDCGAGPVKPTVTVRNLAALDSALGGYQALILEHALREAGAGHITLEPSLRDTSVARRSGAT